MKWLALVLALVACGKPPDGSHPADGAPEGSDAAAILDGAIQPDAPPDAPSGPEGDAFTALQQLDGLCTADHWCWRWPRPHGNTYGPMYASAHDNIWLTAWDTVLQWDGYTWRQHRLPVIPNQPAAELPFWIAGNGRNDVWVIYGTALVHWDGATWTLKDQMPTNGNPNFNDIWVAANGDVWVTVSNGTIRHAHANGPFETINTGCGCFLGAIWGTSPTDIFITTLGAGILHYDGTSFAPTAIGQQIAGSYQGFANDVWVSGGSGNLMHWTGAAWTNIPTGIPSDRWIEALAAPALDDMWWWFFGGGGLYPYGGFLHWNGMTLEILPVAGDDGTWALRGPAKMIEGVAWLLGSNGTIYTQVSTSQLKRIVPLEPEPEIAVWKQADLHTLFGTSDHDAYVATTGVVKHWDGTAFAAMPGPSSVSVLGGIHTSVDELFAFGLEQTAGSWVTTAWHYDGAAWTRTALETAATQADARQVRQVFAMAGGEAMIVGSHGLAAHFANGTWTTLATGTTVDLFGVYGPDPDHVWMNAADGTLLAWRRTAPGVATFDPDLPTFPPDRYGAIRGAGGVAWVGMTDNGFAWKSTGTGWITEDTRSVPYTLFPISATNVISTSSAQTALARWNGTAFHTEDTGDALGIRTDGIVQIPGSPTRVLDINGSVLEHP